MMLGWKLDRERVILNVGIMYDIISHNLIFIRSNNCLDILGYLGICLVMYFTVYS